MYRTMPWHNVIVPRSAAREPGGALPLLKACQACFGAVVPTCAAPEVLMNVLIKLLSLVLVLQLTSIQDLLSLCRAGGVGVYY